MNPSIALAVIAGACAVALPSRAWATFQVQPTTVELDSRQPATSTGSVTVTNRSNETVRFHVKVMAWGETADGQMTLSPTSDVVVYPSMFAIPPGESRGVRIAAAVDTARRERSYRVFVEELPPLKRSGEPGPTVIKVLTRMAIPVFVAPTEARSGGEVDASVVGDHVRVELRNRGSVRVRVAKIRVRAGRQGGAAAFDRTLTGWYLLAGGTRVYQVEAGPGSASALDWIRVEVTTDRGVWERTVPLASQVQRGQ